MDQWKRKSTFLLSSQDRHLGITEAMLRSEVQMIGYDLSKVEGYDPNVKITSTGWPIVKHFLLGMMQASEFKKLDDKLKETGLALNHARMKMLRNAATGWPV